jgi:hypothetical protein
MDLISFLTTHFLEETIGGRTAPPESDARLQQLEFLLSREGSRTESSPSREEGDLIRAYLDLSVEDLDSLSPEVHEWFLERLTLRPPNQYQREPQYIAQQIGRLFFLSNRSTERYLVIAALLALDERVEEQEQSSVAFIWDHTWNDDGLSDAAKENVIATVTDILLDQHYFCRRSRYPLRALAQLLQSEQRRDRHIESRPVYTRIAARAHLLGERLGSELASILREM